MTVSLDVRSDFRQVRRLFAELGPGVSRAASRALNKTATSVRADVAREIQKKRNLRIGVIKKQLKLKRATKNYLLASIEASGEPIAMRHFGANATKKGVTVRITKGTKRIALTKYGNKSFIVPGFAGNNIFVRKTKKRLHIVEWQRVPGIPTVFLQEKIREGMESNARTVWDKRFKEEINYEIQKASNQAAST